MSSFGEWLSDMIASVPMTRRDFAEKVHVSLAALGGWCRGTQYPRADNVTRIALALGVPREQVKSELEKSRESTPAAA